MLYSNSWIDIQGENPSFGVNWRTFVVNQLSRMNSTDYNFRSEKINEVGHAVYNLKEPAYTDM